MSRAASPTSPTLNVPFSRFWRSSLVFHGALIIPESVVKYSVGKKAQKRPRAGRLRNGTAHTSGRDSRSASSPASSRAAAVGM